MKYLTQDQVVRLHQALIETSGGSFGIRDEGMLNSALKTPLQTYIRAVFSHFAPECKVGSLFNDRKSYRYKGLIA